MALCRIQYSMGSGLALAFSSASQEKELQPDKLQKRSLQVKPVLLGVE